MQNRKVSPGQLPSRLSNYAALAVLVALSSQAPLVWGAEEATESQASEFVRIRLDEANEPLSLETATVRYTRTAANGSQIVVDLIGVVHIGDQNYYETLNEQFKQYDALLYELVAPEGTRVPKGGRQGGGADPLSGLQTGMKDMLGLEFQLDHIDYHQDNFIHADMSPEEFLQSMSKNDESFSKMFFRMLGSSLAAQGSNNSMDEADLLMAMFANDREIKMRRIMARQLSSMDIAMVAFQGSEGSTIINHRNGKCFEVLDREIEAGKEKLGVFYGAGHLPDMEKRLLEKGFQKDGSPLWYVAWPLTRSPLDTVVTEQAAASPSDKAPVVAEQSPSDGQPSVSSEESEASDSENQVDMTQESAAASSSVAPCPASAPRNRVRLFRWRR